MGKNKLIAGISTVLITLQLLTVNVCAHMSSENVVIALNCGGSGYTDSKGIVYEKVKY